MTLVRAIVEWAFKDAGMPLRWTGHGEDERGYRQGTGRFLVEIDPRYLCPTEVEMLTGNPPEGQAKLGWRDGTTPRALARKMVQADLQTMRAAPIGEGA